VKGLVVDLQESSQSSFSEATLAQVQDLDLLAV
jgi:hypothetical protein